MSKKAAILDSDFTIKTSLTKNSRNECLSDIVLKLPYAFYCHEQNKVEIKDHSQMASTWLEKNIEDNNISCVSDFQILQMIRTFYNFSQNDAIKFYSDWLKTSCDVFTKSFYEKYYMDLEMLKQKSEPITDNEFCDAVKSGDFSVGESNNLGEIKDIVLAITLTQCLQMNCINFCSDDNRARRSLLSFSVNESFHIKSISYMGFYWVAKQKRLLTKEEEKKFLTGWKNVCQSDDLSIAIKEHLSRRQPDYPKKNIDDLFVAIWNDEVVMVNDGYLVYKTEFPKDTVQPAELSYFKFSGHSSSSNSRNE